MSTLKSHSIKFKHIIFIFYIILNSNFLYGQIEYNNLSADDWKNHFSNLESYTDCEGLYSFTGSIYEIRKTTNQHGYLALKEINGMVYIFIQDETKNEKKLIYFDGVYFKPQGNGRYQGIIEGFESTENIGIKFFYNNNLLLYELEVSFTDLLTNIKEVAFLNVYNGEKIVSPQFKNFIYNKYVSQGSGFIINKDGYILTNKHVITGGYRYEVYYHNKKYQAKYIGVDTYNDLALLKIDVDLESINYIPCFSSQQDIKLGMKIYALGYPSENILGSSVKLSDGIISSINGYNNSASVFQMSIPINPGNSGGPIINEFGNVLGVATSQLKDTQNITFAIKTDEVVKFLKSKNITFCSSTKTISDDDVFSKTGDACVIIKLYSLSD